MARSRSSRWREKKRREIEAAGWVRPPRTYLCKICHADVKGSEAHARYFGKGYCPNDPNQKQTVEQWRASLRQKQLDRNEQRRRDQSNSRQ